MKRSEMEYFISRKLRKQEHLFQGWKNGSIDFRCLVDNLSGRILTEIESTGVRPPGRWSSVLRGDTAKGEIYRCSWEPEDE